MTRADGLLDLVGVREILRERLARPVEHRHEHDAAAQTGPGFEQPVVGEEAAHDVLRRLDSIAARDDEPIADDVVERTSRRARLVALGHCNECVDVRTEARRKRRRDCGPGTERVARGLPVRTRPSLGVEARRVGRERVAELDAYLGGQRPELVGPAERRVREVHDPQVRAQLPQLRAGQRELVVVDQDDVALRCSVRGRLGEGHVHRAVGVPRVAEVTVEARPPRAVEQVVEEEPQHAVRNDVVVHRVHLGIEGDEPQVDLEVVERARRRRRPVVVGDRGRDPGDVVVAPFDDRPERAGQTAGAPLRGVTAVPDGLEPVWAAVRDDDHADWGYPRSWKSRNQSSSSRVDKKLSRTCPRPASPISSA